MVTTLEELNMMYRGICEAIEKIGFHVNPLSAPIRWDNSVRAFATTTRDPRFGTPRYYITVSKALTEAETDPVEIYETLVHEAIHCVDDCMYHTGKWKMIAEKFNATYGTKIQRTGKVPEAFVNASRYRVRCEKCGYTVGRQKLCDLVKHPEFYSCGKCGGNFKRVA